jgi:hypothetical protein
LLLLLVVVLVEDYWQMMMMMMHSLMVSLVVVGVALLLVHQLISLYQSNDLSFHQISTEKMYKFFSQNFSFVLTDLFLSSGKCACGCFFQRRPISVPTIPPLGGFAGFAAADVGFSGGFGSVGFDGLF